MNIFFTNRIGWDNKYICIMRSWLSKSRRLRTAAMGFVRSVSQARLKSFDHRKVTCHRTNLIFLSRHLLIQTRTDSFRVSVYEPRDSRRNKTPSFFARSLIHVNLLVSLVRFLSKINTDFFSVNVCSSIFFFFCLIYRSSASWSGIRDLEPV